MEKSQNVGSIPPRAAELIAQMNQHPRFLSLWGFYQQFRTLLKKPVTRIGKKPFSTLVAPCFSQDSASGPKGKKWPPDSGRISHLKTERLITRKGKRENGKSRITSSHRTARTPFTFYADIEISQINAILDVPVPSLQIRSKCQIHKLPRS